MPRSGYVIVTTNNNNIYFTESAALPTSGVQATVTEVHDEPRKEAAFRRLSEADRILLESLDIGHSRPRPTGRFLTMHKRRRKRLTTRSLTQEPGILDDIFHGLVQVSRWSSDINFIPSDNGSPFPTNRINPHNKRVFTARRSPDIFFITVRNS